MQNFQEIILQKIIQNKKNIDDWFASKFSEFKPLVYNSVDLRRSSFKISAVDTNCFPAGFNNLSAISEEKAALEFNKFFNENFTKSQNILIFPEAHTSNIRYLKNVKNIEKIISKNAKNVAIATLDKDLKKIEIAENQFLEFNQIARIDNKIFVKNAVNQSLDFSPDLILLNNDLSSGIPEIFKNIENIIIPNPNLGWFNRKKSHHFDIYNSLATEIAEIIDIDPWFISSLHESAAEINFKENIGIEELATKVDILHKKIAAKYRQYSINQQPYSFIKADSGTYGMAVWAVSSPDDVLTINKKERNKMNITKGSIQNSSVIIQEGIPTIDKIYQKFSEPMIYLINAEVVGNLFRVNAERNEMKSLNASGAEFYDLSDLPEQNIEIGFTKQNAALLYQMIAKIACLASSIENSRISN
jgi:glutamate--cysteine ligase